jgi:hypothetical protein
VFSLSGVPNSDISIFFFSLLLFSLVSAQGLKITQNQNILINKTVGTDEIIILTIFNDNSIVMSNLTFETNNYITYK